MNKKERRRLLNRIKTDKVKKPRVRMNWPAKVEAACTNVTEQIKDLSGKTLTRGEALCLIKGAQIDVEGKIFRSLASGELVRPFLTKPKSIIPEKIKVIAERIKNSKLHEKK